MKGNISCDGSLTDPNIYTKTVDNMLTLKLCSTALTGYYTKSYVDTALACKQPLIDMLTALSVDSITATGVITAAGFTTTGTANLGTINADILYLSTMMQSAGTISVGTLSGSTWTDKFNLEANGDGTFAGGITTAGGILSHYVNNQHLPEA